MSNSRSGFNSPGRSRSTLEAPSLTRSDRDVYERGKSMSLDALDKSFANKLKAHGYLKDESNLRFYSTRQKTVRAMSANDSFSNFGEKDHYLSEQG